MIKVVLISVCVLTLASCRRSNYICECTSNNSSFQNVYQNATSNEADEYCEAAQELHAPGHINLECHAFEIEED